MRADTDRRRSNLAAGRLPIRGLAMVEMLVAVAAGLFLVAGILQVLVSSRGSYRLAEANARVQENGRYATQIIADELRGTRGAGCRSAALEAFQGTLNVTACALLQDVTGCSGKAMIGPDSPIGYSASQATTAGWLAGLPGDSSSGAHGYVAETWLRGDVLVVWGAAGEGVLMQADDNALGEDRTGTVNLTEKSSDLQSGDLALLSDCEASDIFVITNPKDASTPTKLQHGLSLGDVRVNAGNQLQRSYNRKGTALSPGTTIRARVYPFDLKVYYIGCVDSRSGELQYGNQTGNCTSNPDRYRPTLCRWRASDDLRESLIMDVADMRVTYDGPIDSADSAITDSATQTRFLDLPDVVPDAAWVTARGYWDRVASARVEILTSSGLEARTEPKAPAAATVIDDLGYGMGADRRVYGEFAVTVAIRSHAPWFVAQ